ncbi:Putative peroxiredoxin bcp [Jannaschia seosinensis]|uniref:thioredoxin-dependent peroxiredoxin n=1 Tax=Jannaschia seosinensis TaxID=313367 RepID=A0A0M7BDX9_9RHOB|nr:peroxiredoxin [Jannaschia seosinensis]CUH40034.1 Putative peroxiredoxin bcp [Jannaschia seosinensis]
MTTQTDNPVKAGDPAPDFTLPAGAGAGTGGEVSLSALRGKTVVLYFYPKDDTPGCTKQGIAFSEAADAFAAAGAVIVGVSKDSVVKHDKFAAKHGLNLILASDEDGTTCEDYGVWVEKNMYGKTFMGIERTTFLIDPQGIVQQVWGKVKVPGHIEEVLGAVSS